MKNSSETTNNGVNYFDGFIAEGEAAQAAEQKQVVQSDLFSCEEFKESFFGIHAMASALTGIQALKIPNSRIDETLGGNVAETLYETILDVPMLHFVIKKDGKWLGRAFIMITYVQGMRGAIIDEVGARPKQAKAETKPPKFEDVKEASKKAAAQGDNGYDPNKMNALFNGGE